MTATVTQVQVVEVMMEIMTAKIITNINGKEYEYAPPTNEANLARVISDDFTIRLSDRV